MHKKENDMKKELYYFSGTGNSAVFAGKLQKRIEGAKLFSIAEYMRSGEEKCIKADLIGIICPIYMYNMPHIVHRFISNINSTDYIFFVFTGGGEAGAGIKKAEKIFKNNGLELSSAFNVTMPSNYTPYGYPDEAKQKELFVRSDDEADRITKVILSKRQHFDSGNTGFFKSHLYPGILYNLGYKFISKMDNGFKVDDSCTSCGICKKVCPVDNISFQDGKPHWNNSCEQCLACLHWCPEKAVQYNNKTENVKRYHHPEIKLEDIIT